MMGAASSEQDVIADVERIDIQDRYFLINAYSQVVF